LFTILALQNLLFNFLYRKFWSSNSMRRISSRKLPQQGVCRKSRLSRSSRSGGIRRLPG
jgi:hypothetical protein